MIDCRMVMINESHSVEHATLISGNHILDVNESVLTSSLLQ